MQKFVGTRVGDLFDVEKGTADEAMMLDKLLHDLGGNIVRCAGVWVVGWQIIEQGSMLKGFTLRASQNCFRLIYNEACSVGFRREGSKFLYCYS